MASEASTTEGLQRTLCPNARSAQLRRAHGVHPIAAIQQPLLDYRRLLPRQRNEDLAKNLEGVATVKKVAAEVGATAGQAALAWLLRQGNDVVPTQEPSAAGTSTRTSPPCQWTFPTTNWPR